MPAARNLAPIVVGAALRAGFLFVNKLPSPDEVVYLGTGRNILDGNGIVFRGEPQLHFPPLLPVVLGLLAKLTPSPHDATRILGFVAATAAMGLIAILARRIGGPRAGRIALWLAALSPLLSARIAYGAGGSEAPALAAVLAAAVLAVGRNAHSQPRILHAFGVGLAVGVAYLIRPETVLVAPLLALVFAWRSSGGDRIKGVAAVAVGVLLCATPYIAFLHSHTGRWQLTAKSEEVSIRSWELLSTYNRVDRDVLKYGLEGDDLHARKPEVALSKLARQHPTRFARIVGNNLVRETATLVKPDIGGFRLVAPTLIPLALIAIWRRRRHPEAWAPVALIAVASLTNAVFFAQERYMIPVGAGCIVLGAIALSEARRWLIAVTVVLSVLWLPLELRDRNRVSESRAVPLAAEWIRANDPAATVMARSKHIGYFLPQNRFMVVCACSVDDAWRYARFHNVKYLMLNPETVVLRPQLAPLIRGNHLSQGFKTVYSRRVKGDVTTILEVVAKPSNR